MCEVICHEGDQCPPCPLSEVRHCPCGKNTYKVRTDYEDLKQCLGPQRGARGQKNIIIRM